MTIRTGTSVHAHCDVLVAGGGAAGLMAALQAGRRRAVILADEQNEFGGWLLRRGGRDDRRHRAGRLGRRGVAELQAMPDVTLLPRTTVFGYMDHNF